MERCPVCGTELYENRANEFPTMHLGQRYRFCSADHRDEFEDTPGEYD
jgi:YHS domain-containing protein